MQHEKTGCRVASRTSALFHAILGRLLSPLENFVGGAAARPRLRRCRHLRRLRLLGSRTAGQQTKLAALCCVVWGNRVEVGVGRSLARRKRLRRVNVFIAPFQAVSSQQNNCLSRVYRHRAAPERERRERREEKREREREGERERCLKCIPSVLRITQSLLWSWCAGARTPFSRDEEHRAHVSSFFIARHAAAFVVRWVCVHVRGHGVERRGFRTRKPAFPRGAAANAGTHLLAPNRLELLRHPRRLLHPRRLRTAAAGAALGRPAAAIKHVSALQLLLGHLTALRGDQGHNVGLQSMFAVHVCGRPSR